MGDVKEWAELVEFGVVTEDRAPKTIADAVITLVTGLKHRSLLDNSKCLEAIDLSAISGQIKRLYDELLKEN